MQVAIVTGASSGIGFRCATLLAETGMTVLGVGRDEQRLAELRAAGGGSVHTLVADLVDDDAPQRIVDTAVSTWGHVDYLINNAGVGSPTPLHETDDEALDHFLGLMLRAPVPAVPGRVAAHAVRLGHHQRHLHLRGGGRAARRGVLRGEGRIDRADHAYRLPVRCPGIRCNAVAPGVTLTPDGRHPPRG